MAQRLRGLPHEQIWECSQSERNVVVEMVAYLRAVKPVRMPLRELQNLPQIILA